MDNNLNNFNNEEQNFTQQSPDQNLNANNNYYQDFTQNNVQGNVQNGFNQNNSQPVYGPNGTQNAYGQNTYQNNSQNPYGQNPNYSQSAPYTNQGMYQQVQPFDYLALISLICGILSILSLCCCCGLFSFVSTILGAAATILAIVSKSKNQFGRFEVMALIGLITGIIGICIGIVCLIGYFCISSNDSAFLLYDLLEDL